MYNGLNTIKVYHEYVPESYEADISITISGKQSDPVLEEILQVIEDVLIKQYMPVHP